jgi:hypothetical protein
MAKQYTIKEKQAAIARVQAGEPRGKVGAELSINPKTLGSWMRRAPAPAGTADAPGEAGTADGRAGENAPYSAEYGRWLDRLRASQARVSERVIAAFVEFGNELIEAKKSVPHGEWYPLLDELGIDHTKAERLMNIAAHPYLSNPAHAQDLPPAYTSLAELARLNPDQVEQAVQDGEVTKESERAHVVVTVNKRLGELPPEATPKKAKVGKRNSSRGIMSRFQDIRDTTYNEIDEYLEKFPSRRDDLLHLLEAASDRCLGIRQRLEDWTGEVKPRAANG